MLPAYFHYVETSFLPMKIYMWEKKNFQCMVCFVGRIAFFTHVFTCVGVYTDARHKIVDREKDDKLLPWYTCSSKNKMSTKVLPTFFLTFVDIFLCRWRLTLQEIGTIATSKTTLVKGASSLIIFRRCTQCYVVESPFSRRIGTRRCWKCKFKFNAFIFF